MRTLIVLGMMFAVSQVAAAEDRTNFGLQTALGIEQQISTTQPSQGICVGFLHGQVLTRLVGSAGRERLQLVNELTFGETLMASNRRFLIGSAMAFRLHEHAGRKFAVFTDIGAGVASSAFQIEPKNSGWLQYILLVGVGVRFRPHGTAGVSYILEYRATHLSNHGTDKPNFGLNMNTAVIGINFH